MNEDKHQKFEEIKNTVELWKNAANRAYPNFLSWEQLHWLISELEYSWARLDDVARAAMAKEIEIVEDEVEIR